MTIPRANRSAPAASDSPNRRTLQRRGPAPLALEQRFMFDGAGMAGAADAPHAQDATTVPDVVIAARLAEHAVAMAEPIRERKEIVFIDAALADKDVLIAAIKPGIEVIELDGARDGVQQIADALAGRSGIDAVHVLSHGSDGQLTLGNAVLASNDLANYSAQLDAIGHALSADGDLLLYGCDIAASGNGAAFLEALARATGADVAASSNATSAPALGGDLTLEYASGQIDASLALRPDGLDGYAHFLALNYTNTTLSERGETGTLHYNGTQDNGFTQLTPGSGFGFRFFGTTYTDLYVGSNSYLTFGAGSAAFSALAGDNPALPALHVSGADNSYQRVYAGFTDASNSVYWVRYEGTNGVLGVNGVPNMVWEAWFYKDSDQVDLKVISNARTGGTSGATDGVGSAFDLSLPSAAGTQIRLHTDPIDYAPTLTTVSILGGATEDSAYTISYAALAAAANEADQNGDAISFRVAAVSSGTLSKNGIAVTPGVTLLSAGESLVWTPAANANGTLDGFTVQAWDGALASSGAVQVQVNVAAVNDAPTLAAPGGPVYTDSAATDTFSDHTGTLAGFDVDAGTTLGYGVVGGTDDGTTVSRSGAYGTLVVTKASGAFIFTPNAGAINARTTDASENFTVSVSDGTLSTTQIYTVSILGANDAPTIDARPASIAVTEDTPLALTGFTFADVDAGATSVSVTFSVDAGSLAATASGNVTVGGSNATRTLNGSLADINSFIASGQLIYTPALNATANATLTTSINDNGSAGGAPLQAASSTTLTLYAVNDAPTVQLPGPISATEEIALLLTGISFADVDAGASSVTATLSVASADGALSATSNGAVTVGGTASALNLSGAIADINAFIAASRVTFTPAGNVAGNIALTASINDGGNTGAGGARSASAVATIALANVNDAPTLGAAPLTLAPTNEDTSAVFSVAALLASASLADADAGALSGLALSGAAGQGSWEYSVDGVQWSAVNQGAALSATNALLLASTAQLRYVPNAQNDETASLAFRAWDQTSGTAGSRVATTGNGASSAFSQQVVNATLDVAAINDAPTTTAPASMTVAFGIATGLTALGIGDVDAGASPVVASFTVGAGALSASSGNGVTVGGSALARTLTGTVAELNAFLGAGRLSYTAAGGADATLAFSVFDQGNTGAGGARSSATRNVTLQVAPASSGNSAPLLVPATGATLTGPLLDHTIALNADNGYFGGNPADLVADLNGDGMADIVQSSYALVNGGNQSTLSVTLSDGNGGYGNRTVATVAGYVSLVKIEDLDGDGHQDLVLVYNSSLLAKTQLITYRNDGQANFSASAAVDLRSNGAVSIVLGDLDGDGKKDLVTQRTAWINNSYQTSLA